MSDKWVPPDVRPYENESLESWAYRSLWAEVRAMRESFAGMIAEIKEAAKRDLESSRRMEESDRRPRRRELHELIGDGDASGWPESLRPETRHLSPE